MPWPPQTPAIQTPGSAPPAPLFLYIPVGRLIILSIITVGLYEAYWMYKNWRYIKERDQLNIRPFWRGIFSVFFCHSLLRRIYQDTEARTVRMPSFAPEKLAGYWIVLIIIGEAISRAPVAGAIALSAFVPSFLCLVPVQNYINSVSKLRNPSQAYHGWSSGHILCLVIGILIWVIDLLEVDG